MLCFSATVLFELLGGPKQELALFSWIWIGPYFIRDGHEFMSSMLIFSKENLIHIFMD